MPDSGRNCVTTCQRMRRRRPYELLRVSLQNAPECHDSSGVQQEPRGAEGLEEHHRETMPIQLKDITDGCQAVLNRQEGDHPSES
jgi:hypothetical protein